MELRLRSCFPGSKLFVRPYKWNSRQLCSSPNTVGRILCAISEWHRSYNSAVYYLGVIFLRWAFYHYKCCASCELLAPWVDSAPYRLKEPLANCRRIVCVYHSIFLMHLETLLWMLTPLRSIIRVVDNFSQSIFLQFYRRSKWPEVHDSSVWWCWYHSELECILVFAGVCIVSGWRSAVLQATSQSESPSASAGERSVVLYCICDTSGHSRSETQCGVHSYHLNMHHRLGRWVCRSNLRSDDHQVREF